VAGREEPPGHRLLRLDAGFSASYAYAAQGAGGEGSGVAKLNENVCAQIERAAKLLRTAAAERATPKQLGRRGVSARPSFQEFVDTAAALEALIKRSRRQ
jgi:hypothetical protein